MIEVNKQYIPFILFWQKKMYLPLTPPPKKNQILQRNSHIWSFLG